MIFDELHRTGAEKWEKSLDKLIENQSEETKSTRNNSNTNKRCR